MSLLRIVKHMLAPRWVVSRAFPKVALDAIESAVATSERLHEGEIRVAVEAGLDVIPLIRGLTARQRAEEVFSSLRVWDTERNSGVLIYIQLIDHRIEIVADRGISALVPRQQWEEICLRMEAAFRQREFLKGVQVAIEETTLLLARHFPASGENPDELRNRPAVL